MIITLSIYLNFILTNKNYLFDPLIQFESLLKGGCWCIYDVLKSIRLFELSRIQLIILLSFISFYIYEVTSIVISKTKTIRFKNENFIISFIKISDSIFVLIWFQFASLLFAINCSGLLPFSYVLTCQLIVILMFSTIAFGFIVFEIMTFKKIFYLNHFLPAGIPILLVPLISSIEFISVSSRIISIAVRIFANITAGHALLKIFSIFFFKLVASTIIMGFLIGSWIIFGVSGFILLLEAVVSGLQAYVFTTLFIIYVSETRSI